jgi:O-antigen ligase
MSLIVETGSVRAGWAFLLSLFLSLAVLLDGLNNPFGDGLICFAFSGLVAGFLLIDPPRLRVWRRAWPALLLICGAVAWAANGLLNPHRIEGATVPVAPDLGWPAMVGVEGYVAALLCGLVAGSRRMALARFIDGLLLLGCGGLLMALALQGDPDASWIAMSNVETGRFYGTMSNANAAAAYYGVLAVLALSRILLDGRVLWSERAPIAQRILAAFHILAFILTMGGCLLTASRSGTFFAGAAIITLLLHSRVRASTDAWMRWIALGACALLLAGFAGILLDRLGQLPSGWEGRTQLWRHNWQVAWRSPLFGFGLGSFSEVQLRYLSDVREAQAIWTANSPHNIALRLMLDAGLPYLLFIALAGSRILIQFVQAARSRSMNPQEAALLLAIAMMLGSASIDIALEIPALTALTMVFIGLLWGRAISRHGDVGVTSPILQPANIERLIGR